LPSNAPDWCYDLQEIVNRTEAAEDASKRHAEARLMREMVFALPHELSQEQQAQIIRETVQKAVDMGMIAVVAIHAPSKEGSEKNYHAHVCLSMRDLDPESKTGFGKKNRAWDDMGKGKKSKGAGLYKQVIGRAWEQSVNSMMESVGLDERIDMRSYKEQGLELEPEKHISHKAWKMEQRGIETDEGSELIAIQERNKRRIKIMLELEEIDEEKREIIQRQQEEQTRQSLTQEFNQASPGLTQEFNQAAKNSSQGKPKPGQENKITSWEEFNAVDEENKRERERRRQRERYRGLER
jgi:MobA/MobL family